MLGINSHGPIISKVGSDKDQYGYGDLEWYDAFKGYQRLFIILPTISLGRPTFQSFQGYLVVLLCPILGRNLIEKAILKA